MEIAVYGGTFNPPTIAHEAVIEACLARPDIDEVWVMPSGERADKQWQTTDEERLAMLGLLKQARFGNNERLQISTFELDMPDPTMTWFTARELSAQYPRDIFRFVFGADSYLDMPRWQRGHELQRTMNMLLVPRDGYELPPEDDRLVHLAVQVPCGEVSSTQVRHAMARGEVPQGVINPVVARFITQNSLYACDTIS